MGDGGGDERHDEPDHDPAQVDPAPATAGERRQLESDGGLAWCFRRRLAHNL